MDFLQFQTGEDRIITAAGEVRPATPANGTDYGVAELRTVVGGWLEITRTRVQNMILVVNEEGWLLNLPPNPIASALAGQPIAGDVLFCHTDRVR